MYRQFNIQQFYVLPPQCIYVFLVDLEKIGIISLYNIDWLFYNGDLTLYSPVVTTCNTSLTFKILPSLLTFCLCVLRGSEKNSDYFPIQH